MIYLLCVVVITYVDFYAYDAYNIYIKEDFVVRHYGISSVIIYLYFYYVLRTFVPMTIILLDSHAVSRSLIMFIILVSIQIL